MCSKFICWIVAAAAAAAAAAASRALAAADGALGKKRVDDLWVTRIKFAITPCTTLLAAVRMDQAALPVPLVVTQFPLVHLTARHACAIPSSIPPVVFPLPLINVATHVCFLPSSMVLAVFELPHKH